MALHILPREKGYEGIVEGLNNIMQRKINELQHKKSIDAKKETFRKANLPEWLAEMPENLQEIFLKEYDALPPDQKAQAQQQVYDIDKEYWEPMRNAQQPKQPIYMQGQNAQPMPEQEPQPHTAQPFWGAKPLDQPEGSQLTPEGAESPMGTMPPASDFNDHSISGMNKLTNAGNGFTPNQSQAQGAQAFPRLGHGTQGGTSGEQNISPSIENEPRVRTLQERGFVRKGADSVLRKEELKAEQLASKETKKYYDTTLNKAKAAQDDTKLLNKMEKLVKKGDLPIAAFYSLYKNLEEIPLSTGAAAGAATGAAIGSILPGLGTVVGGLIGGGVGALVSPVGTMLKYAQRKTSPDTEEFEKLSAQFIKGAKEIFPGRVTNQDLTAFLAQIPTLANTDTGKMKIIKSMKISNEAEELRARTMKKILNENKGKRPANLQELVEERAKPELDRLSQEFLNV